MKKKFALIGFILFGIIVFGKTQDEEIDHLIRDLGLKSMNTLKEFLAIPNDAHYPDDIEMNVRWCENKFSNAGFTLSRLSTETVPLVLAEKRCNKESAPTVLIYLQIDGQPVDPSFWFQDSPYEAVLKQEVEGEGWVQIDWDRMFHEGIDLDWRIFARSTSDSKGAVVMFLTALQIMDSLGLSPGFHMKVIMDFEEELGSPHLPAAVEEYKEALEADMLIIFDGPMHITNKPTLSFGARGISTITLVVHGPVFPQHSGHYGNYAPNPAMRLSQLLGKMKDADGRVVIPGFYDGIEIQPEVHRILQQIPDNEDQIKARLGIAQADKVGAYYQASLQYPSLNIRGLSSGWVGPEVRTIIPAAAIAEIDIRLVMESDPERLIGLVRQFIEDEGYHIIDRKPTYRERLTYPKLCTFTSKTSYLAFRTEYDSQVGQWLFAALSKAFEEEPIRIRTSGGSIPISPFITTLGIPAVGVLTANRDNNQHSPNENLRLANFFSGIKTILAILREPIPD